MTDYLDFHDIKTKGDEDFINLIINHNWPFGPLESVPCRHGNFANKTVQQLLLELFKRARSQASQNSTVIEVVILFNLIKNKIF